MLTGDGNAKGKKMSQDKFEAFETHLTHLSNACDEISDVVALQQTQIDRLTRFIEMMAEREVERETQGAEANPDKRPPHW